MLKDSLERKKQPPEPSTYENEWSPTTLEVAGHPTTGVINAVRPTIHPRDGLSESLSSIDSKSIGYRSLGFFSLQSPFGPTRHQDQTKPDKKPERRKMEERMIQVSMAQSRSHGNLSSTNLRAERFRAVFTASNIRIRNVLIT